MAVEDCVRDALKKTAPSVGQIRSTVRSLRVREFNGVRIQQREDGYWNATQICKANGKKLNDYTRSANAKEFLKELATVAGIPVTELIQSRQGGDSKDQGTWVHKRIAIDLARWCSPRFAVLINGWVEELMTRGRSEWNYRMSSQLVKVDFHGDQLDCVEQDGKVWVSVRRVCESLGIDHASQYRKLKKQDWACVVTVTTHDSSGREQEATMVDLDTLPQWLVTIDANRVASAARPKLVDYQKECARVLRDHFLKPKGDFADRRGNISSSCFTELGLAGMEKRRPRTATE